MKIIKGTEPGASAMFSDDERYRYVLERNVMPLGKPLTNGRLVACGLNPSTADAFKLDPTCRRDLGFARSWGLFVYVKINAYAWRDTVPAQMWRAERSGIRVVGEYETELVARNPLGEVNDHAIRMALTQLKRDGGIALACWGRHAKPDRVLQLSRIAYEVGVQWMCLGRNKEGSPKHTLYLSADAQLEPWA